MHHRRIEGSLLFGSQTGLKEEEATKSKEECNGGRQGTPGQNLTQIQVLYIEYGSSIVPEGQGKSPGQVILKAMGMTKLISYNPS